jgi:hypothetical protein
MTGGINGRAADKVLRARNREPAGAFDGCKDADRLGHDFRTNAVSGEDRNAVLV